MVPDENSSQEYPINAGVSQGPILVRTLFLLHNMTFLMMLSVILLSLLLLLSTPSVIKHFICDNN